MFKYLVPIGTVLYLLKLSGFCFSQFEWKTDRELIEAAFRHEQGGGWSNTPAVPDIATYIRDYPRCCSVGGSQSDPFLNALFGRRFYEVAIKYPVTDPAENRGEPFYEAILIMDCCAEDIPDRYGMPGSTPVPEGPAPRLLRRESKH